MSRAAWIGSAGIREREPDVSVARGGAPSLAGHLSAFTMAYAAVVFGPTLVPGRLGILTVGDLVELVATFVVVALVWSLHRAITRELEPVVGSRARLATPVLAAASTLYVYAAGMHLAANAVARHLGHRAASTASQSAYFFDEVLSHLVWSTGLVAMSVALLISASQLRRRRAPWFLLPVAALFGLSWFADSVEGRTVPLVLPASVLALGALLVPARRRPGALSGNCVHLFYAVALGVAVALFLAWFAWRGGFPEFSAVGWI